MALRREIVEHALLVNVLTLNEEYKNVLTGLGHELIITPYAIIGISQNHFNVSEYKFTLSSEQANKAYLSYKDQNEKWMFVEIYGDLIAELRDLKTTEYILTKNN